MTSRLERVVRTVAGGGVMAVLALAAPARALAARRPSRCRRAAVSRARSTWKRAGDQGAGHPRPEEGHVRRARQGDGRAGLQEDARDDGRNDAAERDGRGRHSDGRHGVLKATGGTAAEKQTGEVSMIKEGGAWKVQKESWKNCDVTRRAECGTSGPANAHPECGQCASTLQFGTPVPCRPVRVPVHSAVKRLPHAARTSSGRRTTSTGAHSSNASGAACLARAPDDRRPRRVLVSWRGRHRARRTGAAPRAASSRRRTRRRGPRVAERTAPSSTTSRSSLPTARCSVAGASRGPAARGARSCSHGLGDTRASQLPLAGLLLDDGYRVMAPTGARTERAAADGRLRAARTGRPGRLDGVDRDRRPDECVFAAGTSMGAAIALQALGVGTSARSSPRRRTRRSAAPRGRGSAASSACRRSWAGCQAVRGSGDRLRAGAVRVDLRGADPIAGVARTRVPVLVIEDADDDRVPPGDAARLARANPRHVTLWRVPGRVMRARGRRRPPSTAPGTGPSWPRTSRISRPMRPGGSSSSWSSPSPPAAQADDTLYRLPLGDPARKGRELPVAVDTILDTASGATLTPEELAARLHDTHLLLVGESHTSVEFHRVQLQVVRALHRAGRRVLIGLEMYPYTGAGLARRMARGHVDRAGIRGSITLVPSTGAITGTTTGTSSGSRATPGSACSR